MSTALPLQQSPQFARALAAYGTPLASTAPVVMQRRIGATLRVGFASRIGVDQLDRAPRLINGETDAPDRYRAAGYRQIITPAHVAEWDLTRSDRRARMHGKWRNRLRRGEDAGLRLREVVWDGADHWLFPHAAELARRRRFRGYPLGLLAAYAGTNPGDAILYEAYCKGHPVAACLVLCHGARATYQTAWASPLGHKINAPRVLLDHAATRLATRGHQLLDLGLVETDHAPGLARFKLGSGAVLRPLGGTWLRLRGADRAL